jgi:hypothetical protein
LWYSGYSGKSEWLVRSSMGRATSPENEKEFSENFEKILDKRF